MARLLLLVLLGGEIFLLVRALWRSGSAQPKPRSPGSAPEPATMVACASCGVHMPESEALIAQGQPYCCEAHRRRGPARQ